MNRLGDNSATNTKPNGLKPKATILLNSARWTGNISPVLNRDYLIKDWLSKGTLTVMFGPSNVGKSFLAVDIAHHVAKGQSWAGSRVNKGNVLYIAAEGGNSFSNRIAALSEPEFWIMNGSITLAGPSSDTTPLIEMMQHLAHSTGSKFDLIIVDTLSRVMGNGDENAAPDIADLVRNLDLLRNTTGANVLLVHHTGKDVARGARGHSSLRAAVDTEVELTRDDYGTITAEITKQRDGPTGKKFSYRLRRIELGLDQDGDPVSTCLVEPTEAASAARAEPSGPAKIAIGLLHQITKRRSESTNSFSADAELVSQAEWMEVCISDGRISTSRKREALRKAFNRAMKELISLELVAWEGDQLIRPVVQRDKTQLSRSVSECPGDPGRDTR